MWSLLFTCNEICYFCDEATQAQGTETTSCKRRCDIMASQRRCFDAITVHRRWYNVVLTSWSRTDVNRTLFWYNGVAPTLINVVLMSWRHTYIDTMLFWCHDVAPTLMQWCFDVRRSYQRRSNVVLMSCACLDILHGLCSQYIFNLYKK